MALDDQSLLSFIQLNNFEPNAEWEAENPLLHCWLANELFDKVQRLIHLIPEKINPNLCDGPSYGSKSLLILLTLLPSNKTLVFNFINKYKTTIDFNYQDLYGRTAMHYAVILGRYDLFCALQEMGVSDDILDDNGMTALDYLHCSAYYIMDTLQTVDINGLRDVKATQNTLLDHTQLPVTIHGIKVIQTKQVIEQILAEEEPLLLINYTTPGSDWGSLNGDDYIETATRMLRFAEQVADTFEVPVSEVFSPHVLDADQQQQFRDLLTRQLAEFTGISILDECLEGHNKIAAHQAELRLPYFSPHLG